MGTPELDDGAFVLAAQADELPDERTAVALAFEYGSCGCLGHRRPPPR